MSGRGDVVAFVAELRNKIKIERDAPNKLLLQTAKHAAADFKRYMLK